MKILKETIDKIVPASEERMQKKAKELNSILMDKEKWKNWQ